MEKRTILEVKKMTKRFGGVLALSKVDVDVREGELVGLIGPNGSGKSTLFDCITGYVKPDEGAVLFKTQRITGRPSHEIALLGITRTFQSARVFPRLTVLENLMIALQQHQKLSTIRSFVDLRKNREFEDIAKERAWKLLDVVRLREYSGSAAKTLSHGQRKLLNISMALMPKPAIMLLDEPTAAVNPKMIEKIKEVLIELNKEGHALFVIEHNMQLVSDICERVIVLDHGEKIAEDSPDELKNDPKVIEAYLGV